MKKIIIGLMLVFLLGGCSTIHELDKPENLRDRAMVGQLGDIGTTVIAVNVPGIVEANPLEVLVLPLKYAVLKYADGLGYWDQRSVYRGLSAFGFGPAVNNICVILAVSTGGAASGCLLVGIAAGVWDWNQTGREMTDREFFDSVCAHEKRKNPEIHCVYRMAND